MSLLTRLFNLYNDNSITLFLEFIRNHLLFYTTGIQLLFLHLIIFFFLNQSNIGGMYFTIK